MRLQASRGEQGGQASNSEGKGANQTAGIEEGDVRVNDQTIHSLKAVTTGAGAWPKR
jgi:hypothetical protein